MRGSLEEEFTFRTGGEDGMLPRFVVESRTTYHTSSRPSQRKRPDWLRQQYKELWNKPHVRVATNTAVNTKLKPAATGPLALNEYRFWRAANGHGRCRNCMLEVVTPKERMEHQKTQGCTRLLVDAYKLLLRDKKCVVCDVTTSHTKWGIPLCNNTCMYRWQFETGAGAYTVQMALKLEAYRQGGAKNL